MTLTPLPDAFLRALDGHDEVLVTSRDRRRQGTVPTWYTTAPPGVLYLFTQAFSRKAVRWRSDPWVMLTVPGSSCSASGVAHLLDERETEGVASLIVARWDMAGATTVEALRRLVAEGTHVVVRVEGTRAG